METKKNNFFDSKVDELGFSTPKRKKKVHREVWVSNAQVHMLASGIGIFLIHYFGNDYF